jgi:FHS family Na+ dependent glucose MFS transporter 1
LAGQTAAELDQISVLFTAHALGYMFGSFFGGRLYDLMPGNRLMSAMLLLMVALLVIVPLAPLLWLLAAAWLLLGVTGGALDVGGNTLLVWVHGREVGPYMNGLHFFFGIGSFLTPLIVAVVIALTDGIAPAYWLLALLIAPVAVWLFRTPSPVFKSASPQSSAREGGEGGDSTAVSQRPGAGLIVLMISLLLLLYVGAEAAFGGWVYTYALTLELGSETAAAFLTSAFWGALTLGRLLAVPVAFRVQPHSILLADLVGCLASVALLLLWPGSVVAIWLAALGLGLSMASVFPTAISLAERQVPITGRVTGWFLVGASVGAMLLPWLIGQLFESVGPQITMVVILLDLLAALAVGLVLTRMRPAQA